MEKESVWMTTERDKNERAAGVEYSRYVVRKGSGVVYIYIYIYHYLGKQLTLWQIRCKA